VAIGIQILMSESNCALILISQKRCARRNGCQNFLDRLEDRAASQLSK
jgi:hypothetical protein